MEEFDESEIEEFRVESNEMLEQGEEHLLAIERGEEFLTNYDAIFRVFHSLKGAAGMLGMEKLQNHMHHLENLLTKCKEVGATTDQEVTYFLKGVDVARRILNGDESAEFDYTPPSGGSTQASAQSKPSATPTPEGEASPQPETAAQPTAPRASPRVEKMDIPEQEGLIYIVDDEPAIVELLDDILKGCNFETRGFTDPKKALEAVKDKQPHVVISDLKMPGLSGNELLAEIHKINPDLPVILVSGYLSKQVLIEVVQNGAHGVIEKPFNNNAIITLCVTACKKYRTAQLLNRTIKLLMYQFSDLEAFLLEKGKEDVRNTIKSEIEQFLQQRRELRKLSRAQEMGADL